MKLDKRIEVIHDKLEDIIVPGTNYTLMDYNHGRCHLFAQAIHEEFGFDMEFLWDVEYLIGENEEHSTVLAHAYCILPKGKPFKGKYVDARGGVSKRMIEREYDCNRHFYEPISIKQLNEFIKSNKLCTEDEGEVKAIRDFIRTHRFIYS